MSVISVCELLSGLWIRKTPKSPPHIPKSPGPKLFYFRAVFGDSSKFFHFRAIFADFCRFSPHPNFYFGKPCRLLSMVSTIVAPIVSNCCPLCRLSSDVSTVLRCVGSCLLCRQSSQGFPYRWDGGMPTPQIYKKIFWGGSPPPVEVPSPVLNCARFELEVAPCFFRWYLSFVVNRSNLFSMKKLVFK